MNTLKAGKFGEDLAVAYLQKRGYQIIERNFRIKGGEIDIIAVDGETLVYVEVKTRSSYQFGRPEEAITPWKIRFLQKAAKFYRMSSRSQRLPALERIDVVTVDLIDSGNPHLRLIQNAPPF